MVIKLEQYEERIIAFIDILGFRNHVYNTVDDPKEFIKLRDTLNYIESLVTFNDTTEKEIGKEVTVFSDSIVISYSAEYPGSVFWLLLDVVHIQIDMMEKGILVRGGITVGELCHNDNIVYGPAMVKAYELESKAAIYPRVVIDEKVFITAVMHPYNPPNEEIKDVIGLCNQDRDGQFYVDFLSQQQEISYEYDYLKALIGIKNVILSEIQKNELKPDILMKYQWLKNYYNEVVSSNFSEEELNLVID